MVRQYFDKVDAEATPGFSELHRHPFIKAAVYPKDKIFMTPCMAYCSMK
jgi:hypothetical protein